MKRPSFAASLALAVVSVMVLAGPAAAGKQVPFKGRLEAVVTSVTPLVPPMVSVAIEGEGRATQLGHFTVSFPHVVDRSTGIVVGTYEFTAANGDTLTADFTGQVTPTDVPGVVHVEEEATITGGTGRFAGATGSFTGERLVHMATGTTEGFFEGTISSRGAGKR